MPSVFRVALATLVSSLRSRRALALENLALRHQRAVLRQAARSRPLGQAFAFVRGMAETAPRFVMRDRHAIYGAAFAKRVESMGIEEIISAPRSPWQNPYVKQVIGSIRRDCLDHVIVLGENHLPSRHDVERRVRQREPDASLACQAFAGPAARREDGAGDRHAAGRWSPPPLLAPRGVGHRPPPNGSFENALPECSRRRVRLAGRRGAGRFDRSTGTPCLRAVERISAADDVFGTTGGNVRGARERLAHERIPFARSAL